MSDRSIPTVLKAFSVRFGARKGVEEGAQNTYIYVIKNAINISQIIPKIYHNQL